MGQLFVLTRNDLPTGTSEGQTALVLNSLANYRWTGVLWQCLDGNISGGGNVDIRTGEPIDLSEYVKNIELLTKVDGDDPVIRQSDMSCYVIGLDL